MYEMEPKLLEKIQNAMRLLDSETKEHSYRVAQLAYMNTLQLIKPEMNEYVYQLALAHDLYEDTDIPRDTFSGQFNDDLLLLTRNNEEEYLDYIRRIDNARDTSPAYIVKIADLIDHLTKRDTLKESLKERYIKALVIFCPGLEGIDLTGDSALY